MARRRDSRGRQPRTIRKLCVGRETKDGKYIEPKWLVRTTTINSRSYLYLESDLKKIYDRPDLVVRA